MIDPEAAFLITAFYSSSLLLLWILMILSALVVAFIPIFRTVAQHGKRADSTGFCISKRFFQHFYLLATCLLISLILDDLLNDWVFLSKWLFLMHCSRRLWECHYITLYGQSKMHIGGYLCGLAHYTLAIISFEFSSFENRYHHYHHNAVVRLIGIAVFTAGNFLQYHSHLILYRAKVKMLKSPKESDPSAKYSLPREGLFWCCASPHYFSEILIYASFLLIDAQNLAVCCMVVWVVVNLSIVAYQQYSWYLLHHFDEVARRPALYVIFPFLW
jgi:3-oxo-5-alpha-steroid 4-dehydrogenase 3